MQLKRAFVALQDRFVSSLAVACCPTMDLVAVITLDRHLLVHRTTSWQKLLHIKPSDVGLEMTTLAWRPDGLQLAVGCDEGDVAVFEIESSEVVPVRRNTFRHENAITAMHWAEISDSEGSCNANKPRPKVEEDWAVKGPNSQSKRQFRRRASRFLAGYRENPKGGDTVLVTADTDGQLALWWMGRVLLTHVDVRKYFSDQESRILDSLGQQGDGASGFRIERVDIAPDLSLLIVMVAFYGGKINDNSNKAEGGTDTKVHRMLTLDMASIQHMREDVMLVADTVDHVHTIVNRIGITGKQMITEWKNATRIFELKMGLIGSLYEKYACEDPPQVDMLSAVVSGITAPALAQYFAQDIQEMSIHRMQKALFSGCSTLEKLSDEKMKRDLVDLLFLLSELRGHAKWNPAGYASSLGITVSALDNLAKAAQDTLVAMETFTLALHETRQDFVLFFQWLLERIRVHTSSNRPGDAGGDSSMGNNSRETAAQGSKSLLNLRRLCDFLQHASEAAQSFRKIQPRHNKYKVETTFGNTVSHQLMTQSVVAEECVETSGVGCIVLSEHIQKQWIAVQDSMISALANTLKRETSGCFTVGIDINTVQECCVRFRRDFNARGSTGTVEEEDEDDSDVDEDEEEAVDWSSLKHFGLTRDGHDNRGTTILMGFRMQSGELVLVRATRVVSHSTSGLTWDAAVVNFSQGSIGKPVILRGFDFYGDAPSDKGEQLALILQRTLDDQAHQEWLYLQSYDHIEFSCAAASPSVSSNLQTSATPFETILAQSATHTFRIDRTRGRAVTSSTAPAKLSSTSASVIAIASRGTLCVMLPPSRLVIFDAEDSEDDDDEDDDNDEAQSNDP